MSVFSIDIVSMDLIVILTLRVSVVNMLNCNPFDVIVPGSESVRC